MIVLNFHGIGDPKKAGRTLEPNEERVWVSIDIFEQILDGLGRLGDDVKLTFDDGNVSDVSVALPRLIERKLKASFFLISDRIDTPGAVSTNDVHTLLDAGMNIGVHGKSHCAWGSLDRHKLSEDIMVGKETLERFTGNSLTTAACPFGSYNRFVLGFLQKHGFTNVYTSDAAVTSSSSWLRARFSVHDTDTIDSIVSQVATARSFPRSLKDRARIMVKSFR